jgi:hypothetical protein
MQLERVRKSVFIIHSRPVKGNLNLKARKLIVALARSAGQQYKRLPREQREGIEGAVRHHVAQLRSGVIPEVPAVLAQPRFVARLRDLADLVGHDPSDSRHLLDDLHRLITTEVELNVLQHGAAESEKAIFPFDMSVRATLLSSLIKVGRGTISWGYDPMVLLVMVNPRTYTDLSLQLNRNARTYTALTLYENVRRFLTIGRAGPYPIRRWQELLSEIGEVRQWENVSEFRKKIRRALAELDAVEGCDIEIEYKEVSMVDGRGAEFLVSLRPQYQLLFGEPIPENRDLVQELEKLGFPAGECRTLIETHGEEDIYLKLKLLKKSQERQAIRDVRAWFVTALKADWQDKEQTAAKEADEKAQSDKRRKELERLKAAHQALRSKVVGERLAKLSDAEREDLRLRYLETPEGARCAETLGETTKGFQSAWSHWLASNTDWLKADHLADFTAFVLWAKAQEQAQPAVA